MAPGARSEEAYLWFSSVCEAVQEIPAGKVTSYAHIAKLVGKRDDISAMPKVSVAVPHAAGGLY
ncbi:hypothetical protein GRF29_112g1435385 [Pseudopithomyces chartarum]|uniref:Methylated-DNA-[protein]-cysteine S-methyltransferase DNA binding domain-containing protein n=1 Tax=Pseudopithomyces chartarum TaxID=1892770 RepID=A0AAN6LWD7_9PLEO|nr:hypothetical protein GRF29_112g1435385 [Pseudopithomyces chartarum]